MTLQILQYMVNLWTQRAFPLPTLGNGVTAKDISNSPNTIHHSQRVRALRFIEEAIELAQACGLYEDDVVQLVDEVYVRHVGTVEDEIGGTLTTLAALANSQSLDMGMCTEKAIVRMCCEIDRIRERSKHKKF